MKFTLQPTKRKISQGITNIAGSSSAVTALSWTEHVTRTGDNRSGTDRFVDLDVDDGIARKSASKNWMHIPLDKWLW
jgi:hypothetical protein